MSREFRGQSLSELGKRLHRFPQDVIPYNPVEIPSVFVGPKKDPRGIVHVPVKGHKNLPSTYAAPWDEIPDNVKRRTEAELEAREEQVNLDWVDSIRYKDRQVNRQAVVAALRWTAGLGTLAGFTYALFSVR